MENTRFEQNDAILTNLRNLSPEIYDEFLLEIQNTINKNINVTENLILENKLSDAITKLESQRKYKNIFKKFVLQDQKCNHSMAYDLGRFDGVYSTLIELVNKIITLKDKQQTIENILNRKYVMEILLFVYKNPLARHKMISEKIGVKANYLNELMSLLIRNGLVNKYQSGKYSNYSLSDKGISYMKARQRFDIQEDPSSIKNYNINYDIVFPDYKSYEEKYQEPVLSFYKKDTDFVSDNCKKIIPLNLYMKRRDVKWKK